MDLALQSPVHGLFGALSGQAVAGISTVKMLKRQGGSGTRRARPHQHLRVAHILAAAEESLVQRHLERIPALRESQVGPFLDNLRGKA
jgi:hypothetical protein